MRAAIAAIVVGVTLGVGVGAAYTAWVDEPRCVRLCESLGSTLVRVEPARSRAPVMPTRCLCADGTRHPLTWGDVAPFAAIVAGLGGFAAVVHLSLRLDARARLPKA